MTELPPPILSENGSYENWRNEIQMWQITTTMEPKRQALAVRAKLCGKVREAALKLDASDLNNDSGMSFLIDALDASFRKPKKWDVPDSSSNQISKDKYNDGQRPRKWDVPNSSANQISKDKFNDGHNIPREVIQGGDSNLSATDRARLRAAQLSNKLAAAGKYQTQPLSLLPKSLPDQFGKNKTLSLVVPSLLNINPAVPRQVPPEVKKMENGNSFAEFNINDVCARPFLTRSSTRDLIAQQSGAAISLRGRFLTHEDKRQGILTGIIEKPLVLMIQANVAAKVQVALHKIMEVCRNYEKFGAENNFNNYGLSNNLVNSTHHFVQEKLFVGVDNIHPDFNLREKLAGENGANFSFMVQQTGAKVFLRGRGSGYVEPNSGRESFEALHIYISHPRQDGLDMARQLCESLIETVKSQYEEWGVQRIAQSPSSSFEPRYRTHPELCYPIYSQNNGYNTTTYASIPSLMSKEVKLPVIRQEENQSPPNTTTQSPHFSVSSEVVDYRLSFSKAQTSLNEPSPHFSQLAGSVNELRMPESNFDASNMFSEKEKFQQHPGDRNASPNENQRFHETGNREKKSDRSSRRRHRSRDKRSRSHSKSPTNTSPTNKIPTIKSPTIKSPTTKSPTIKSPTTKSPMNKSLTNKSPTNKRQSKSPETKKPSRFRELKPKTKDSPRKSPNRKESSPTRRESPHGRRDSPPSRRDSSPSRRDSPPGRRDSPSPVSRVSPPVRRQTPPIRRKSPPTRKESAPIRKEERTKRRFTEEPKKKRKFSEDPRLLEQAKVVESLLEDSPEREMKQSSNEYLQVESRPGLPPPKLQFRSKKGALKKETPKKPKSILKMAPPPMLPIAPKKINGLTKSVTISPAGLTASAKKMMSSRNDKFKPPPPMEMLKPPQAPQKVLKMGALSSLSMYEGDSDEDD